MLELTARKAKEAKACEAKYEKFAKFKGGVRKWGIDKPFPLLEVLENNGLSDALWTLELCEPKAERDRIARLFACDCVERVLHFFEERYPNDSRPRQTIGIVRLFTNGLATRGEMQAASSASSLAAGSAASLAGSAAALAAQVDEREWQTNQLRKYLVGEL